MISNRVRVRLEFTVIPKPRGNGHGMVIASKLSFLRKLLNEKFGPDAAAAFDDWLLWCAQEQEEKKRAKEIMSVVGQ